MPEVPRKASWMKELPFLLSQDIKQHISTETPSEGVFTFKQHFTAVIGFVQENQRVTGCHTLSVVEETSHRGECSNLSFIVQLQVTTAEPKRTLTPQHTIHSDCIAVKSIITVNTTTERILWKQPRTERIILHICVGNNNNKSALIFLCNTFQILNNRSHRALKGHEKVSTCQRTYISNSCRMTTSAVK